MDSSSSFPVEGGRKYTNDQHSPTVSAAILKFLRVFAEDYSPISELSKFWQVYKFQLGDNLVNYNPNERDSYLYLICEGKVRILGFDPTLEKQVSTQLLLAEQSFGVDHLFCEHPLTYQAIAAANGWIAKLPICQLQQWLQKFPHLKASLHQTINQRQALIFFKTHTDWRSQTSRNLLKIIPHLEKITIRAGSPLSLTTPQSPGKLWLIDGIASTSLQMGDCWEYSDRISVEGKATTDLSFYYLPSAPREEQNPILEPPQPENPETTTPHADINVKPVRLSIAKIWHFYPFVRQQSSSDCGAACLAMVSQYWGKRFSLHTLCRLARVDQTGSSLTGLLTAAETLGYEGLAVKADLSNLASLTDPWIAHWQGIHYVVVWQCTENRVLIGDPAIGKRSLTVTEFTDNWTGYALLLSPTPRLDTQPNEKISLHQFWQSLRHYRHLIVQIIFASFLMQVFGILTPLVTQIAIDHLLTQKNLVILNLLTTGFLCFGIWQISLKAVRQYLLDYFAQRMDIVLLGGFVNHLLRLPLQFFISRPLGDLIACVQENRKIQIFLTRQAVSITLDALMTVISVGLLASYNWQLTLWLLLIIVAIASLSIAASPWRKRVLRELWKASAQQHSSIVETITGIHTIKTASAELPVKWRWEDRFANMVRVRFRGQKLTNNLQLVSSFIKHLGTTGVLWYGSQLVISGQMTIGQFVGFNMLMVNAIHPLVAWIGLWDEWQEILISLERLQDVWSTATEENPQQPLTVLPPLQGAVKLDNVSFRYHPTDENPILNHISLTVQPQQTIGIVGASGAGKTTLVNLLTGLYPPTTGSIFIDGYDMTHISLQSLRLQLGVVPQECRLFSGTIADNITLYNSQFTLEQAIAAAKLADADQFIQALALGYKTPLGEGGINLSGGEKQKIAIARALINKPKILILDEATSFLDSKSEKRLQLNLAHFNCTKFIITHRLASLRHADSIYVLDKGMLVEQGTHDQLMAIGGHYYHLTQQQFLS
jgi:ATP-binding cassette subfamily B protein